MRTFNALAMKILSEKYFSEGENTPEQLFDRVAASVAFADALYRATLADSSKMFTTLSARTIQVHNMDEFLESVVKEGVQNTYANLREKGMEVTENDTFEKIFNNKYYIDKKTYKDMMLDMEFMPGTPTLINAGKKIGMLSSCFFLRVHDSLEDIFDKVKHVAMISKAGGGVGLDISELRPKGAQVSNTNGTSSGPVSFLKVFDEVGKQVQQGGIRRAALIATMRVDHPDILDFITCKEVEGNLANFNLSVIVDDVFMQAVKDGTTIQLTHPTIESKTIQASVIWDKIVEMAYKNGEPGVIFKDATARGDIFSNKFGDLGVNPCVVDSTWVTTANGPAQVKDLCTEDYIAIVDNKEYPANKFFKSGIKDVFEIQTVEGFSVTTTGNHKFKKIIKKHTIRNKKDYKGTRLIEYDDAWVAAENLEKKDIIRLANQTGNTWDGIGTFDDGYAVGLFLGDGHFSTERSATIDVWKDGTEESLMDPIIRYARKLKHRSDFKEFKYLPEHNKWSLQLTALGTLANKFGLVKGNKHISPVLEKTSYSFYCGFLRGFFDADGSVQGGQTKGVSIRLSQSSLPDLEAVQRMLLRLGIYSTLYKRRPAGVTMLPDSNRELKEYPTKAQYELVISNESVIKYSNLVSFYNSDKLRKLEEIINNYKRKPNKDKFIAHIKSIKKVGTVPVFDTTVEGVHAFDGNGFYLHNCGEINLLPYESCNLGAINLSKMFKSDVPGEEFIDTQKLIKTVKLGITFLDNIIEINKFPLEEIRVWTEKTRRLGLGVMGLHDLLLKLKIVYGSTESLGVISVIYGIIQQAAQEQSILLGDIRGVPNDIRRSAIESKHNFRNAGLLAAQPTGTISMICNQTSSGIEPVFQFEYGRKDSYGEHEIKHFIKKMFPDTLPDYAVTALEISPQRHVDVQAALQKYIDNSISKTVNLPNNATQKDVAFIIKHAHESGCKSVTMYRSGSRKEEVLSEKKDVCEEVQDSAINPPERFRERPRVLFGATTRINTPGGKAYITVNEDKEGAREVFVHISKAGSEINTHVESEGRLISNSLKYRVPPEQLIQHMEGHKSNPIMDGGIMVRSVPDAVATVMREYMVYYEGFSDYIEEGVAKTAAARTVIDHKAISGEICPECGEVLYMAGGCTECASCGFSRCG